MSSEQQTRLLAYLKWEKEGRPPGDGVEFWLAAEAELVSESDRPSKKVAAKVAPVQEAARSGFRGK